MATERPTNNAYGDVETPQYNVPGAAPAVAPKPLTRTPIDSARSGNPYQSLSDNYMKQLQAPTYERTDNTQGRDYGRLTDSLRNLQPTSDEWARRARSARINSNNPTSSFPGARARADARGAAAEAAVYAQQDRAREALAKNLLDAYGRTSTHGNTQRGYEDAQMRQAMQNQGQYAVGDARNRTALDQTAVRNETMRQGQGITREANWLNARATEAVRKDEQAAAMYKARMERQAAGHMAPGAVPPMLDFGGSTLESLEDSLFRMSNIGDLGGNYGTAVSNTPSSAGAPAMPGGGSAYTLPAASAAPSVPSAPTPGPTDFVPTPPVANADAAAPIVVGGAHGGTTPGVDLVGSGAGGASQRGAPSAGAGAPSAGAGAPSAGAGAVPVGAGAVPVGAGAPSAGAGALSPAAKADFDAAMGGATVQNNLVAPSAVAVPAAIAAAANSNSLAGDQARNPVETAIQDGVAGPTTVRPDNVRTTAQIAHWKAQQREPARWRANSANQVLEALGPYPGSGDGDAGTDEGRAARARDMQAATTLISYLPAEQQQNIGRNVELRNQIAQNVRIMNADRSYNFQLGHVPFTPGGYTTMEPTTYLEDAWDIVRKGGLRMAQGAAAGAATGGAGGAAMGLVGGPVAALAGGAAGGTGGGIFGGIGGLGTGLIEGFREAGMQRVMDSNGDIVLVPSGTIPQHIVEASEIAGRSPPVVPPAVAAAAATNPVSLDNPNLR